ncbi:class I SAM-dependent methyltransferase [Nocardia amamiensis]|uniref:Class I SAM-dependent methyltransferase n=1 Tax=Nocardia amamiensis TaxID=404578 RepID=A0ABS0D2X9_9NOCA|nr:class I SAM-dependent methyltransferase [Nocardia amamiensis]MBF6302463.1 class I SAM-dependent methyltransferase [Nocardia amamiensis]
MSLDHTHTTAPTPPPPLRSGRHAGLSVAQIATRFTAGPLPVRITAYDGSATGPADSSIGLHLANPRGLTYLATAPGELGLVRAYIAGDLRPMGVPDGDPYRLLAVLVRDLKFTRPPARELARIAAGIGWRTLIPVAPPGLEAPPRWRRNILGSAHSRARDAAAVAHHYDLPAAFYRLLLGPSMVYTCAVYPHESASLDVAQDNKMRLIFDKLALRPGDRVLDIGCGWGSFVRYCARRGVHALGVTLSREQAQWAREAITTEGLAGLAEVRHGDYRDIREVGFDAITSMGVTEHIGLSEYGRYFGFIRRTLAAGGRLINHCVTRPDTRAAARGSAFTDRYLFPDGELAAPGRIISGIHDAGLEVIHAENLRSHYALTLRDWSAALAAHWDQAVALVGAPTARAHALLFAGGRLRMEGGYVQCHQVLAVRPDRTGTPIPLNQWWDRNGKATL